ncbi:MAG TPA: sulfite exporter TauE/SafE family protein [Bdellovibrionales bacterium]|nr:sulfite exporter TauE/SafE family protein [Bdellovibrionales bacterium]
MSALFNEFQWLVPFSVFIAGFIGSPHCLAMCGPLALTIGRDRQSAFLYQLGRLLSYTTAGIVAGTVGNQLLDSNSVWLSSIAVFLLAGSLILLAMSYSSSLRQSLHFHLPPAFNRFFSRPWLLLQASKPSRAILALGAGGLTVLLPCAHLYAFLVGAALTNSALNGAIFMAVFWLSTIPALGLAPALMQRFLKNDRQRWASSLLLLAALISLFSFAARLNDARASQAPVATKDSTPHCH